MKSAVFILMVALAQSCYADNRADKIATLIRITHLREQLTALIKQRHAVYEARANDMVAQEMAAYSPNPEYERQYEAIHARFIKSVESALTADAYINVVSQYYSEHYTTSDLNGLIRFYSSPLGQKDREVAYEVSSKITQEFSEQSRAIDEAAMNDFIADYRKLSASCKCLKKGHQ